MITLVGGDLVLADRVVAGSLLLDGDRIVAVEAQARVDPAGATVIDATGHLVVPGFIDVHVHGVDGHDTLDADDGVSAIAARLPRYGVTAFCPTTVACPPVDLQRVLGLVRDARRTVRPGSARVLPAHLESNFISPAYRGAQPASCLRLPGADPGPGEFSSRDILEVIAAARTEVGLVTLAPELPGGLDLVRKFTAAGHRVALGHSAATFDEAMAAIDAGARHATHLFNRMPPYHHRAPGLVGAVLDRDEVAVELVCDGYHVHPAACRMALARKTAVGVIAVTDGTAAAGLPVGARTRLGGQSLIVGPDAACLSDGTLAGSTLTMNRGFQTLVERVGVSVVTAARLCSTTPAERLGLAGYGVLAEGHVADVVVIDRRGDVQHTIIGGEHVYHRR